MKARISSTMKAHLIRGAVYLLLIVALYTIPFALAQRNVATLSKAKASPASEFLHNFKCSCLTRDYRTCYPSNRGHTGYHPLRSDGQPRAHAAATPVQWGHHIAGLRA